MLRHWLPRRAAGSAGDLIRSTPVPFIHGRVPQAPGGRLWHAASLFLLLAVVHTWPLAIGLSHLSRMHDDAWLNTWAVSWIAHQLPRNPLHLFDANMFHPHGGALAYTEPLVVPGLIAAPIHWLGGSAFLAHNVLVLLGFTFTALAMYALVRAWTGDHRAGLLAGALFAFSTALVTRTAHLQALHIYWLPLAFLALHRVMTRRRGSDLAGLGLCVVGAALTSGYLVVFVSFALAAAALLRAPDFLGRDGARLLLRLSATAAVTLVILLVVLRPYLEVGYRRPPAAETAEMTTALSSYLSSAAIVHYLSWSSTYFHEAPGILFPGVVTLVLAAVAIGRRRRTAPRGTRRMLLAAAGTGFVLSLGALTPVYTWIYDLVPPVQGLRATHRFGVLVIFALAALAGIGLSGLRWPAGARRRTVLAVALLVLATAESFHGKNFYSRFDYATRIRHVVAESSWPGAVLELPIYRRRDSPRNAEYVLGSTVHWRPIVNGYGGFAPPDFDSTARLAGAFPSVLAVAWLQEIDVGYVVMHLDRYPDPIGLLRVLTRLEQRQDLVLQAVQGATRLYRVRRDKARAIEALTPAPVLSQLRFVYGPADGSMLRSSGGLRQAFGFQSPDRFIGYLEPTEPTAHARLRLPVRMSGRFLDAPTGAVLQEVTVQASTGTDPPVRVPVPAGHAGVLLDLSARPERLDTVPQAVGGEPPGRCLPSLPAHAILGALTQACPTPTPWSASISQVTSTCWMFSRC